MFTSRETRLLKRFLFLLIPYSIIRIGFYFYHLNIYKQFPQEEIFESFFYGLRFDIAAICFLNLPIIILAVFPLLKDKWERVLFVLINTVGFGLGLVDYELFLFTGKRLSFDFFNIAGDIIQQLPQLALYYWYIPIFVILFGFGFYFFDKSFFSMRIKNLSLVKRVVSGVLIFGLSFIAIRGGLQHKSINVQSAFVQGKNELGHLVLNTPYHFLRTLKNKPKGQVKYFATDDEAKNIILNRRDFRDGIEGKKNANVVLIILESFSSEYIENGYAPFLTELKTKSWSFDHHLANGRRSIEALPSILCGLPSLLEEPISKSIYQGNKFTCFPKLLKQSGYTNYFFHAGSRGTMGFESYTLSNGFDKYFSREDYGKEDYDGTWGVFDEPYFQYVAKKINEMPEPFMAGVFTLSSHQPYAIPEKYKDKFPNGTLEIHRSIGYTDYALKKFFETIKEEKWFQNTIFFITSDHTQKLESKKYQNLIGRYRVPMIVMGPGLSPRDVLKVTQHSDIPKSVLDFVEVQGELPATSVSMFSGDEGVAVNYADGSTYFMIQRNEVSTMDKTGQEAFYVYDWDSGELAPAKFQNPLLKAYLQYFQNGLIKNNLSL